MPENPENTSSGPVEPAKPENKAPEQFTLPQVETETPKDEPITGGSHVPKGGLGERLFNAANGVCEKFGQTLKRGRGRPRKDGSPKISDVVISGGSPVPVVASDQARPSVAVSAVPDSDSGSLFRRVCVSSVKGVLGICEKVTAALAGMAGIEEKATDRILARARPPENEILEFMDSLDLVLKKHNVKPENAEEWSLAITGGRLLASYPLMWLEFRAEMERNRKAAFEEHKQRVQNLKETGRG